MKFAILTIQQNLFPVITPRVIMVLKQGDFDFVIPAHEDRPYDNGGLALKRDSPGALSRGSF